MTTGKDGDNVTPIKGAEIDGSAEFDFTPVDAGVSDVMEKASVEGEAEVIAITRRSDAQETARRELRAMVGDIPARARAMRKAQLVAFKETKMTQAGLQQVQNTDANVLDAFGALFGAEGPYFDEFKGRTVGWDGQVIDQHFGVRPLVEALIVFGIPAPTINSTRNMLKEYAREYRRNSLIERMTEKTPEWDGVPRMETSLMRLFKSFDTRLNREFGAYFWLSLYNRIHSPGCYAPISVALFGTQGSGKSFFGKLISEEVLNTRITETQTLNFKTNELQFLRKITGKSVIANVAEMNGFDKAELNAIKNFATRTVDTLDFKYENENDQPRQWIIIMDGNNYEGLQRDDTGNRRFYPMFVNQRDWVKGDPKCWDEDDFKIDYSSFRAEFWQIMAECRAWMERNDDGDDGSRMAYVRFADKVMVQVRDFSRDEMDNDRGSVRDDELTIFLPDVMREITPMVIVKPEIDADRGRGRQRVKFGAFVEAAELLTKLNIRMTRGVNTSHLKRKMKEMGGLDDRLNNSRGYLFEGVDTLDKWNAVIGKVDDDMVEEFVVTRKYSKKTSESQKF